ncbi:MAG: hypothetical protein AB3X44_16160 [Leptothrix sp. (in: b-proteobacteria)]
MSDFSLSSLMMPAYKPNTTRWPVGSLVIHEFDAKTDEMLMVVTGYDDDTGHARTLYAYPEKQPAVWRHVWRNPITMLHAPERFGIEVPHG